MGPKFALLRLINKRAKDDAEIVFERGAFALETERTNNAPERQLTASTDPQTSSHFIPRFDDNDAKVAPTSPPPAEYELRGLQHKVLSTYKTRKTKNSSHTQQERPALETTKK